MHAPRTLLIIAGFVVAGCSSLPPPLPLPMITEINPSDRTAATRATLQAVLRKYDLKPYFFAKQIQIQAYVTPHSHPVLTLNTRDSKAPERLLGQFLHEQLHWFVDAHPVEEKGAIDQLRKAYPILPSDPSKLAGSIEGTYMHLIVCYLELQALKHYLGPAAAYAQVQALDLYPWIYATVIKDESSIAAILKTHALDHIY